ncbi:TOBE domain protein [compost metagenome]
MVRPERIRLGEAGSPGWSGEICEVEYLGAFVRYRVALGERLEIIVNHPNEGQARLARGSRVSLSWPEQAIHRLNASEPAVQP